MPGTILGSVEVVSSKIDKIPAPGELIFHQGTDKFTMKTIELNHFSFAPMEKIKMKENCMHLYDKGHSPVSARWFPKKFSLHKCMYMCIQMYTISLTDTLSSWTWNALELYIIFSYKICKAQTHVTWLVVWSRIHRSHFVWSTTSNQNIWILLFSLQTCVWFWPHLDHGFLVMSHYVSALENYRNEGWLL